MTNPSSRIYLSPPHMSGKEREYMLDAFDSNWIAPLGPHVDAFEEEFGSYVGVNNALALSSGTAGLHLALILCGVGAGDTVLCPTLTFAATANAIHYCGASPVFIDSESKSWNMCPNLLEEELRESANKGRVPKAVIVVHVFGQSADMKAIMRICDEFGVPVIEDAAESLGATYEDVHTGTIGDFGVYSFNGNKIMTTSGGGMLVSRDKGAINKARYLSTQAREPVVHYEHREIGYNYRLSNVLAAIGRGQLAAMPEKIASRRKIFNRYVDGLSNLAGISFMPEAEYGVSNRWLSIINIDSGKFGLTPDVLRKELENHNIESRPVWKPMHLQPVFSASKFVGGDIAENIFSTGLCLPSGSGLKKDDQERVIDKIQCAVKNI